MLMHEKKYVIPTLTIQTSKMTPLSAAVSRKCGGVGRWVGVGHFHSYNVCWYMRALNYNRNEHIRYIKM